MKIGKEIIGGFQKKCPKEKCCPGKISPRKVPPRKLPLIKSLHSPTPAPPVLPQGKLCDPKLSTDSYLYLTTEEKAPLKFTTEGKCPQKSAPEKCLQPVKLSFRKFKLYLTKFFFEICEIFKNTFLYRAPPVDASGKLQVIFFIKKIKLYSPGIFAAI